MAVYQPAKRVLVYADLDVEKHKPFFPNEKGLFKSKYTAAIGGGSWTAMRIDSNI